MKPLRRNAALIAAVLVLASASIASTLWFLKQPAPQTAARQVADDFVAAYHAGQWQTAYALTVRNGWTGRDLPAFTERAQRETCAQAPQWLSTHPPQSRGNRLRRWLAGQPLDMPRLSMEFETSRASSPCLLGIRLLRTEQGLWRVWRFGRHAG